MNEREKLLMEMILSQSGLTIQEAANIFGVTERTIRNSLDEIDEFLASHQLPPLKKESITSIIYPGDFQNVRDKLVTEIESQEVNHWLEASFREQFIFSEIALEAFKITVEKLESMLQMSKSTVHNDIRKLKQSLKREGIILAFDGTRGFHLNGEERQIRSRYLNSLEYFNTIRFSYNKIDSQSREILELFITHLQETFKKELSYTSFFSMLNYLFFLVMRVKKGHSIEDEHLLKQPFESDSIRQHAVMLEKFFGISLSESEIQLIYTNFQQSHFLKDDLIDKGFQFKLNILAEEFIMGITQRLGIDLSSDDSFIKNLSLHFQTIIERKQLPNQHLISDEMLQQIKKENEGVYRKVKQTLGLTPALLELGEFDEENTALLTIHVVSRIEQLKKNAESRLKVLVICHMGVGTSQFLKIQLANHFSFVAVLGSMKDLEYARDSDYDLLLATVDLPEAKSDYLRVSPYPTEAEIQRIDSELTRIVMERLKNEYNSQGKDVNSPMLKELLVDETIQTNVEATNWEEAIRASGMLLVKSDAVERQYVEKMISVVHEFGPYIVVVPGIALAHASSKDGVKKVAMSLITLSNEGVNFGSKNNDPVYSVISLATIDHDTHLKALAELVQLLNNEEFKAVLRMNDKQAILEMINQTEEGVN